MHLSKKENTLSVFKWGLNRIQSKKNFAPFLLMTVTTVEVNWLEVMRTSQQKRKEEGISWYL